MQLYTHWRIGMAVCLTTVLTIVVGSVDAKPSFQKKRGKSTATITHTADEADSGKGSQIIPVNHARGDPKFTKSTKESKAQYRNDNTITGFENTNTGASTTALGGIAYEQTSTTARALFSDGTGVGQTDPEAELGNSNLRIDFNMHFKIKSSDFTGALASASLLLAGTVGAEGGSVELDSEFNYLKVNDPSDLSGTALLSSPLTLSYFEENLTTSDVPINGTGTKALAGAQSLTGIVEKNKYLRITGFVEFSANNDTSPSTTGFDPNFGVSFDSLGGRLDNLGLLRVDSFVPESAVGDFSDSGNWVSKQVPSKSSIVVLKNKFASADNVPQLTTVVGEDRHVHRIEIAGSNDPSGGITNLMALRVQEEATLTVTEGITVREGGSI